MNRFISIIIILMSIQTMAQIDQESYYFPESQDSEWKWKASLFWNEAVNSDAFTNDFVKTINSSGYLDEALIDKQLENINTKALTGQLRNAGGRFYLKSNKNPEKRYFFIGVEHQHFLDTYIDKDLVALMLKGNNPYKGTTLYAPNSEYYNVYFNQIGGGMGYNFDKDDVKQQLQWGLSLNLGQNYNYIGIENTSFYTDPEGDYLDVTIAGETKLSDTVWAEFYEVKGIGISGELLYSNTKENNYHFDVSFKNLGFIRWNSNAFTGSVDTSFVFEGLTSDTTNNDLNTPSDFDKNGLRRLLFPNAETNPFNTMLPLKVGFSAGKFVSNGKFYFGLNGAYYPFLNAPLMLEFFGTVNVKSIVFVTPVLLYSSYNKLNYGLTVGVNITNKIRFDIGSSYLNSIFSDSSLAGQGGFVKLNFRH